MINLKERKKGLGGSDISVALGINPFKTAYELYEEKTNPDHPETPENEKMRLGRYFEDPIARLYEDVTNQITYCSGMFTHNKHPFLIGHPDRIIPQQKKVVEIKSVGYRSQHLWGESGSQLVPDYYYLQAAHYALVLDYDCFDIAIVVGQEEFRYYSFERDLDIDESIIEGASRFWKDHVKKKKPPEKDYSNSGIQELIKRKHNLVSDLKIVLPDNFVEVKNKLENAKHNIKIYDEVKKESEAIILDAMGDAGIAILSDGSSFLRKRIERKAYQCKESSYVTLTLKKGASLWKD